MILKKYINNSTVGGIPKPRQIYITDNAFEALVNKATRAGYIRNTTNYGLGKYLEKISTYNFIDRRPDYAKWEDEYYLEQHMNLPWCKHLDKTTWRRQIMLSDESVARFIKIALVFHIGARRHTTPIGIVSAVIEAISTDWLEPEYEPSAKTENAYRQETPRRKQHEIAW